MQQSVKHHKNGSGKTGLSCSPFFDVLNLLADRVWPFGVIVIILLVTMVIHKAAFTLSFALLGHQVMPFLNGI
jgi:hypothetical protein